MAVLHVAVAVTAALSAAPPVPHIDVYTMGNGDMIFHRFGHAAICAVYDDAPRLSRCYNYGTTDFGSPPEELGWSFVRGTSPFWVSVWAPDRMIDVYVDYDRSVWRQRIPLSPERALAVAAKLEADAKRYDGEGPNSSYAYHHFKDNCTTRVRDILDEATGGALRAGSDRSVGVTYRELGRRGLADMTVIVVAAHFLLGRDADVEPTEWEAMFLPRVMRAAIENRLGVAPELVYEREGPPLSEEGSSGKGWVLLIGLIAWAPLAIALAVGRGFRAGLAITGGLLSLTGLVVLFVCAVSQMPELRYNEALLVFWPTDWLLAVFSPPRRRNYARVRVVSLLVVSGLLAVGVFRQPLFVPLLIPLVPSVLVALLPDGRK